MASLLQFLLLILYLTHKSQALSFHLPNALVLPITKDVTTLQYVTRIHHGTPLVPINLVVDLGGPFIWTDCSSTHVSSSSRLIPNRSIKCSRAKAHDFEIKSSLSSSQTCELFPENRVTRMSTRGDLVEDIVAVQSKAAGSISTVNDFLFSCGPTFLLHGLVGGTKGMLGLGRTRISLPSQISTALNTAQKFTVCLSSSDGIIAFGEGPNDSIFGTEISRSLMYTPLVTNPGASKLSTIVAYTTMESTIYGTFIRAYVKAASSMNMTRVASVAPFGLCFNSKGIDSTHEGPKVPIIELVLQSETVMWRIFGRNSMVQVSKEVMCLGFLDGGLNPKASIVLGGYQLEDMLLQFEMGTSMLGFSQLLLKRQTTCSNFKFNSWAGE
ncbi:hypothetical protein CMV_025499 [Castanea mollissima]|uniref:Peptidase A1 domain-containing protein n=1 Tax=Castanea mollissima TaxID=60419 RepID=A0A8J4QD55_9ROSI|nr:hypothetical protein CMV_025499 [Castanea mollissima]